MSLLLLQAEWLRFVRQPVHAIVLATLALALAASAVWSGLQARELRAALRLEAAQASSALTAARERAEAFDRRSARDDLAAMNEAFTIARSLAPPMQRPLPGGLALLGGSADLQGVSTRVTVESRHTDDRRSQRLFNPLLESAGAIELATVTVLLLPLALFGLAHGLVHEDREQGRWLLVRAQCGRPWVTVVLALAIRGVAAWSVAAAASALAFAIDPSSTFGAAGAWLLALAVFTAFWALLVGAMAAAPLSSGGATLAVLSVWLATTFALPAALGAWLDRIQPMPSRLAAIISIRDAQLRAEADMLASTARWYAEHPSWAPPPGRTSHTFPVTFLPRFLQQDRSVRPLMRTFESARAARFERLHQWAWLSPGLAMLMTAERLAGVDAPGRLRFVDAVEAHEDAWRAFFVPRVMSYSGVRSQEFDRIPALTPPCRSDVAACQLHGPSQVERRTD